MSVQLGSGGKVLLGPGGKVATDPACCCGSGATGACCDNENNCTIKTHADCTAAGGYYRGDGTNCSPNLCDVCSIIIPSTVTFSGVTIGCCVNYGGSSSNIVPCFGGGICISINAGFALHFNGSPPPSAYVRGAAYGDPSEGVAGSFDYFSNETCTGTPDSSQGTYQWSIWVDCNTGFDPHNYPDFALGWFVLAFDIASSALFFAQGIANPTVPFSNQLICGTNDPALAGFPFFSASHGGTAVLS